MSYSEFDGIDQKTRQAVRDITGVDPVSALKYFDVVYLEPLARRLDLESASVLDCACGSGWLAIGARIRGARRVVACDVFPEVIDRAKVVSGMLGLSEGIEFVTADVAALPFDNEEFDAVCSIETLEHVPIRPAINELARVCSQYFVVETINRFFPIDTHDTPYPLVHFLPTSLRRQINRRYGTSEVNRYPSWQEVERGLREFSLDSDFKTFDSPGDWRSIFPLENPYTGGRRIDLSQPKWRLKLWFYSLSYALLGRRSRFLQDKIIGIYKRESTSL